MSFVINQSSTIFETMNLSQQLAKHFREIYFGTNWTYSNIKDNLDKISWEDATVVIPTFNSIAALTFHINYFVEAMLQVLHGGPLDAHDKFSFDCPPINNEAEWKAMLALHYAHAEEMASLIEKLPESVLWEIFVEEKYGTYYRNIQGIIEHSHYHLGQIVIIKKMIDAGKGGL